MFGLSNVYVCIWYIGVYRLFEIKRVGGEFGGGGGVEGEGACC